ncbi:pyridine nucleotide-disulfide oxidoreductase [Kiloniella spongiae]|uniref:Soluble pyridine nucleotide transhydrogenase n=2 Tax=Kiloniella spongiae TaxID=1489064 RepID=A0A0H2MDY5_9PROT|nr:Si-specific NAD(P)(+) transhydrogenase [Kiloniella spongiae]KLN60583.1 pyridine nucleotide-disulfide oxidoreductase [Kiloniella spongiae]
MERYELVVIGSGPSGRRAAVQAAKWNKRVLVIEKSPAIGGVSVHTGTLPSKTLRETVLNLSGWRERTFYGRSYRVKDNITAGDLLERLHMTLQHEVDNLEHQFVRNKVDWIQGLAHFVDPNTLEIVDDDGEITSVHGDKILIATGTQPHRPDYIPFDGETIIDSDEIIDLKTLPRSLAVIGAGVIGIEYATIFSALDVAVTVIEPRETMLDFIDRELIAEFTHLLRQQNVTFRFGQGVEAIDKVEGGGNMITLENKRIVKADMVLFSAGRMGATDKLSLDKAGIKADHRNRIQVNENFQTEVDHIYAAGDVIGFPSLASTSMEQGRIVACHAFEQDAYDAPEYFPYGIYSVPEMSTVGMSEEEVQQRGIPYECGVCHFHETARGQIMGLSHGMMKMIFSLKTRRLLGVHIVGEGATELIHIGQAVLNLKGTLEYFVENTFNYPTLAEAYKVAALDAWNRMPSE